MGLIYGVYLFAGNIPHSETPSNLEYNLESTLIISAGLMMIWDYFDVAKTTRKYNTKLYRYIFNEPKKGKRSKLGFIPSTDGFNLVYSIALLISRPYKTWVNNSAGRIDLKIV